MAKSPQGFIVVLPGEIIEIAQDDDISWLTLFYALPKELAEKYPDALKIPRSPYEVLYEGSYGAVAKSDMLKCWSGTAIPGLHGSSSRSKTARVITGRFPEAAPIMQGSSRSGGCPMPSSHTYG